MDYKESPQKAKSTRAGATRKVGGKITEKGNHSDSLDVNKKELSNQEKKTRGRRGLKAVFKEADVDAEILIDDNDDDDDESKAFFLFISYVTRRTLILGNQKKNLILASVDRSIANSCSVCCLHN